MRWFARSLAAEGSQRSRAALERVPTLSDSERNVLGRVIINGGLLWTPEPNRRPIYTVVEALGYCPHPMAAPELVLCLGSSWGRNAAFRALGALRDPVTLPALVAAADRVEYRDRDHADAQRAIAAFGRDGFMAVLEAAKDTRWLVWAVEGLGDPLALLSMDLGPTARAAVLQRIDDPKVLADRAENDPDASVRQAAVALVTNAKVLSRIARQDGNRFVRQAAVRKLGDPDALKKLVEDELLSADTRIAAFEARSWEQTELDGLLARVCYGGVRTAVLAALPVAALEAEHADDPDLVHAFWLKYRKASEHAERAAILVLCARQGDPQVGEELRTWTDTNAAQLKTVSDAARHLLQNGPPGCVSDVKEFLSNHRHTRDSCREYLSQGFEVYQLDIQYREFVESYDYAVTLLSEKT